MQYRVEDNMKVRKALLTDAESVSRLLSQLGYQASPLPEDRVIVHRGQATLPQPSGHGIILHLLFPAPAKGAVP